MKNTLAAFTVILVATLAAGCSRHPPPPQGRWEGSYETNGTIVVARLEIGKNGLVRVSAPNAASPGRISDDERAALRERLATQLAASWPDVSPRPMDFDGRVFRKPGGIAPQIIWQRHRGRMALVLYLGTRPAIHVLLRKVHDFSADPFSG